MMKRTVLAIALGVCLAMATGTASADVFGSGANEFTIDFVPITGDASSANGTNIGTTPGFVDPDDFLIGTYEITAGQWNKFIAQAGAPTGNPLSAYNATTGGTGLTAGANLSALEAFQFVNWLNTSTGNQAAYKFVETTPGDPATLTFDVWTAAEADGGTNLFRHKDAWYFLPTEDEWVKAAHWTGSTLQLHATSDNRVPVKQVDANISSFGVGILPVGTFPADLNGTYNMIGNVREVTESPNVRFVYDPNPALSTGVRGGAYTSAEKTLIKRGNLAMNNEQYNAGFRVASIPEPATMSLLALVGLAMLKRRKA